MKQRIIIISILILLATGTLLALNIASDKPNKQKNGFNRNFITRAVTQLHAAEFETEPKKILGATDYHIYFEDSKDNRLIQTDYGLQQKKHIDINTQDLDTGHETSLIFAEVDSHNVYIFVKNDPSIYRYNLATKEISTYSAIDNFLKGIPVSECSFIVRGPNTEKNDNCFKKITVGDSSSIQIETGITELVGDGGFSTDGMLYFDKASNMVCYTFFYRNGFLVIDTNLNIIHNTRTIDTINAPRIIGEKLISEKGSYYTFINSPEFVNLKGCVSDGKLFLRSALVADNENYADFNNNSVFDVYDLKNGEYIGSFYLPTYKGTRAYSYKVVNNLLIAVYGKTITVYKLNFI